MRGIGDDSDGVGKEGTDDAWDWVLGDGAVFEGSEDRGDEVDYLVFRAV